MAHRCGVPAGRGREGGEDPALASWVCPGRRRLGSEPLCMLSLPRGSTFEKEEELSRRVQTSMCNLGVGVVCPAPPPNPRTSPLLGGYCLAKGAASLLGSLGLSVQRFGSRKKQTEQFLWAGYQLQMLLRSLTVPPAYRPPRGRETRRSVLWPGPGQVGLHASELRKAR